MTKGKPRTPKNRDHLRSLMRDVMIRNTRALVDVRLPPRCASTLRPTPDPAESQAYHALSDYVHAASVQAEPAFRMGLKHLLVAAGSSPSAVRAALRRAVESRGLPDEPRLRVLEECWAAVGAGCKTAALLELLRRNEQEKVIVFAHHRATIDHLSAALAEHAIPHDLFVGGLDGARKDEVIERFRSAHADGGSRVLLSTQSGGEGRNIQFCNTLCNFDLPWNPMAIEQRIGRIHRIGQTREVFVFNIAAQGTLEDALLRILDEKLDMFELVVGEIGAILGEIEGEGDFSEAVFSSWIGASAQQRSEALAALGESMVEARRRYEDVKAYDEELFGDELEAGG
jgi:SNF2 family DNA or RNA helicase